MFGQTRFCSRCSHSDLATVNARHWLLSDSQWQCRHTWLHRRSRSFQYQCFFYSDSGPRQLSAIWMPCSAPLGIPPRANTIGSYRIYISKMSKMWPRLGWPAKETSEPKNGGQEIAAFAEACPFWTLASNPLCHAFMTAWQKLLG